MEWMSRNFRSQPRFMVPFEIQEFAALRNMEATQENKFRVLRHKSNQIDILRGGYELVIKGLPRDCFEPELLLHLENFGPVYELRLTMHTRWETRGYAFVKFWDRNYPHFVEVLNHFPIRPGCYLQVTRCFRDCNLLLLGVPFNKTVIEIFEEINRISPGLESVGLAEGRNNHLALANGFGQPVIATYLNHELTLMAKNQMISSYLHMWGERIHVEWATQKTNSPDFPRNYRCRRLLHVLGLSSDISNSELFNIFDEHSNQGVNYTRRREDQAFIYFKSQDQAEMAKERIHATLFKGNFLYVDVFSPTVSLIRNEPLAMEASLWSEEAAGAQINAQLEDGDAVEQVDAQLEDEEAAEQAIA